MLDWFGNQAPMSRGELAITGRHSPDIRREQQVKAERAGDRDEIIEECRKEVAAESAIWARYESFHHQERRNQHQVCCHASDERDTRQVGGLACIVPESQEIGISKRNREQKKYVHMTSDEATMNLPAAATPH